MTDDLLEDLTGDELIDGFKDLLHNLDNEIRTFNQLRTEERNMPQILASGVHILAYTRCIKDWHAEMELRGWNPPEEWPHKNYAEAISKWILEENQRQNDEEDNSFLRSVGISAL